MSQSFKLHYDLKGKGPPVLCLAGFGCSNWIFEDMSERLKNRATWVMPDNRGMGRSPKTNRPYSIADLAEDGLALMDHLNLEKFSLLGISMGGFVAQVLALKFPNRVQSIMLFCSTGPGPQFRPIPNLEESVLREWYQMNPEDMTRANTDATVHPNLKNRDRARYLAILESKLRHRADLDQVLLQRDAAEAFLKEPLPLKTIQCPGLILSGANDRLVSPANGRILAGLLPQAQLQYFSGTDHLFFLEKPAEVATAVDRFLEPLCALD